MKCHNPDCRKGKKKKNLGRLAGSGYQREGRLYCSEECFIDAVVADYLKRKREGRELHSSTHPVTSRALGAALLRMGRLTWVELEEAFEIQRRNGGEPLIHYLLVHCLLTRRDIIEALGKHHRVPVATVGVRRLDPSLLAMIPGRMARLSGIVPIAFSAEDNKLSLLMKDPTDLTSLVTMRRLLDCDVQVFQGDPMEINDLIHKHYGIGEGPVAPAHDELAEAVALAG